MSIDLCDGKYHFHLEPNNVTLACRRNGMLWRRFVGDKAVGALYDYAEELQAENEKFKERIENMTLNGLSPESRLAGFSVVADKQVDRVKELCAKNEYLADVMQDIRNCPESQQAQKLLELREELAKHRWIPVSERLPEEDGQIWIHYEVTHYTYQAYYDCSYKKWAIFDPCGGFSDVDVGSPPTHWKPITLPKE